MAVIFTAFLQDITLQALQPDRETTPTDESDETEDESEEEGNSVRLLILTVEEVWPVACVVLNMHVGG